LEDQPEPDHSAWLDVVLLRTASEHLQFHHDQREGNPATALWASTEPVGTNNLGDTFTNPGASIPISARTEPNIRLRRTALAQRWALLTRLIGAVSSLETVKLSPRWLSHVVRSSGLQHLPQCLHFCSRGFPEFRSISRNASAAGKSSRPNVRTALASSIQRGVLTLVSLHRPMSAPTSVRQSKFLDFGL